MAVYIDPPRWPAHGTEFSHLVSDTSLEELHAFAERIGSTPRAFDRDHYDVPRERYARAVAEGAVEVDGRELVRVLVASGLRVPAAKRNEKVLTALRRRWDRALSGASVTGADPQDNTDGGALPTLREELLERWGEQHRRYHDRTHLLAVLTALDALTDDDPPLEAVLAAWFHDAVYEGRAGSDEEASAVLAETLLPREGISHEMAAEVARLVRVTAHHRPDAGDIGAQLLSDADLAVLGGAPADYADYVRRVREEYANVPDAEFVRGRLMVLDRMDPAALYKTAKARFLWGSRARENLSVEIDELRLHTLSEVRAPDWCKVLPIVGVSFVQDGRLLTVRKRGTQMFMLVGGKREPHESAEAAARREITEEVGLQVPPGGLERMGEFWAPAANEDATWVDSTVFVVDGEEFWGPGDDDGPSPRAEIEELRYLDLVPSEVDAAETTLAPLVRRQVVPLLRRRDPRFWSARTAPDGPYRLENDG